MALRPLAGKLGAQALRRAPVGPLPSPAAGSQFLSHGSWQGRGHSNPFFLLDKASDELLAAQYEVYKQLRLRGQALDSLAETMRRDIEKLRRFRKKVDKIGKIADLCLPVVFGAFIWSAATSRERLNKLLQEKN